MPRCRSSPIVLPGHPAGLDQRAAPAASPTRSGRSRAGGPGSRGSARHDDARTDVARRARAPAGGAVRASYTAKVSIVGEPRGGIYAGAPREDPSVSARAHWQPVPVPDTVTAPRTSQLEAPPSARPRTTRPPAEPWPEEPSTPLRGAGDVDLLTQRRIVRWQACVAADAAGREGRGVRHPTSGSTSPPCRRRRRLAGAPAPSDAVRTPPSSCRTAHEVDPVLPSARTALVRASHQRRLSVEQPSGRRPHRSRPLHGIGPSLHQRR